MIVFGCMYNVFMFQLRSSFTSFVQLLRCPHKRIVNNIMKVYTERNNMQVELNMIP